MYVVRKFRTFCRRSRNLHLLFTANKIKRENLTTILFYVFVVLASVSGAMVIRAKNPVHSVLFSISVFRNTSGLPVSLGLDSSAMISSVVYAGAIAASFPSVVTMLHMGMEEIHENVLRYLPVGGIIGLTFSLEILSMVDNDYIPILPTKSNATYLTYTVYAGKIHSWTNLETSGNSPYTTYFSLFLVSSLIPLVALIGAIVLTMHKTTKVKRQDVFVQNAIDFRNTIKKVRR
uniref:NADH-ubiquinone oxidoreductase chain 6 n=1 Tax=Haplomitrium hookeri TaxID=37406 RepID=A0A4Y5WY38_HAPHO|nr:NADH dehydrogenase subunit 6 [Haplomitrium hookeri]QDE12939.1 NADH dehydrogenase subunit 6 [Haplomitrium hookeri]